MVLSRELPPRYRINRQYLNHVASLMVEALGVQKSVGNLCGGLLNVLSPVLLFLRLPFLSHTL